MKTARLFLLTILHVVFFLPWSLSAQERLECPVIRKGDIIVHHAGHTLSYNPETLLPDWVAYELTASEMEGEAVRRPYFSPDPAPELRGLDLAQNYHYTNSGWVRGHMVPAGDLKYDQRAMNDGFYTTNVCPMNRRFNNGIWKRTEEVCRRWAREYGRIYIVTGPIVGGNVNGKVGQSNIIVPDAFFKAVLIPYRGSYLSVGFLMDNAEETAGKLRDFTYSLEDIEAITGLELFPGLTEWSKDAKRQVPLKELGLY